MAVMNAGGMDSELNEKTIFIIKKRIKYFGNKKETKMTNKITK